MGVWERRVQADVMVVITVGGGGDGGGTGGTLRAAGGGGDLGRSPHRLHTSCLWPSFPVRYSSYYPVNLIFVVSQRWGGARVGARGCTPPPAF